MKKVVHLLPALEQGGVESVVCSLNRAAARAGWASVVVSAGGRRTAEIERDSGVHRLLDVRSKNPLTAPLRAWRLRRLLVAEKPDLVCVHSRVPAWLFALGCRGLGIPLVTYAHGANSVSAYSAVMTRGERVVTPSIFLADYLKKNYTFDRDKLRVIPPAVDTDRFDPSAVDTAFTAQKWLDWKLAGRYVVMAVGRLSRVKGLETLIGAVAELKRTIPEVRCVLVGDADPRHEDYLDELRGAAVRLGVGDDVVFAGGQTRIPECLSLADVVVSANTTKPETFGLSMAEAIVMGKPVVARGFGGALEVVRDGTDGVLTDGESPAAFAEAILRVKDESIRPSRDEAVERFGFARMTRATFELYENLICINRLTERNLS